MLLALVGELGADPAADDTVYSVGNHDPAWLGQSLEPRRNVDTVAVDRSVLLLDHVAEVHADAKAHAPVLRHCVRSGCQTLLNRQRRIHRAGGRFEYGEHRITRHVDDSALMCFDARSEDRACCVQSGQGGMLVPGHQA